MSSEERTYISCVAGISLNIMLYEFHGIKYGILYIICKKGIEHYSMTK